MRFFGRHPLVPSILTPSRDPSNRAIPSSREALQGEGTIRIQFPKGILENGEIFDWRLRRRSPYLRRVELRKERDPFRHEYILLTFEDGYMARIDRRPDPDVLVDTVMRKGCNAIDNIQEVFSRDNFMPSFCVVDVLVDGENHLDVLSILRICLAIQQDNQAQTYTIQRYNCYFFSWTIILLLLRLLMEQADAHRHRVAAISNVLDEAESWVQMRTAKVGIVLGQVYQLLWQDEYDIVAPLSSVLPGLSPSRRNSQVRLNANVIMARALDLPEMRLAIESILMGGSGYRKYFRLVGEEHPLWYSTFVEVRLEMYQKEKSDFATSLADCLVRELRAQMMVDGFDHFSEEEKKGTKKMVDKMAIVLVPKLRTMMDGIQLPFLEPLSQASYSLPHTITISSQQIEGAPTVRISYPELQHIAKNFIKAHADRVDRYQIGSTRSIQNDMIDAMERVWERLVSK